MSSGRRIFLSGATMHPSAILAAWPGARFIARACIEASGGEIDRRFAAALTGGDDRAAVWGLAVEIPEPVEGEERAATTDDGRSLALILAERPLAGGDPEAVLNAALYWELTPAYTARLREAAGVAPPAPEGGWESPLLEAEPASGAI